MNDDSTNGSTAGGGGMNGMEQSGRGDSGTDLPGSEPDYIPLSTKPRQTPGGGDGMQDPMDGGNNDALDGLSNGTDESGAQDTGSSTKNESTGGSV